MKKNFKFLSFLLLSAIVFSCTSIPRTMGPYIEAEAKITQSPPNPPSPPPPPAPPPPEIQTPPPPPSVPEEVIIMVSTSDVPQLETYNIIVGSFSVEGNAKNLKKSLEPNYKPIIVKNERGMFRVIIASFSSYDVAKEELEKTIKSKFADAWILAQKK